MRLITVLVVGLLLAAGASRAEAWGCEGHAAVAILAERLLDARTAGAVRAALAAAPVDAALERYCDPVPGSPIADASTWADDFRAVEPSTAGWHFINVPRIAGDVRDDRQYCPAGNCILDAIVTQFHLLTASSSTARTKADALRFLIHFVGDLHQPLHAVTNGDRGGNCVPVTYRNRRPREDDRQGFSPNLHSLWDAGLIGGLMERERLPDVQAFADYVARGNQLRSAARAPTAGQVLVWARESNVIARRVVYRLPVDIAMEPASAVLLRSCADNNGVGRRLARLDIRISRGYEDAAGPVIAGRIRLASERLAGILRAAFPWPPPASR